jgi:hypothetical protein
MVELDKSARECIKANNDWVMSTMANDTDRYSVTIEFGATSHRRTKEGSTLQRELIRFLYVDAIGTGNPKDRVPPRTSSRSRQKARHANHTLPRVHNLSMNRIAQGSSRATTCPAAPAPAAQPEAALGPPRVLRLQLPLPSPGQLWGRHASYGSSFRCLAWGSSGAATCPLKAQRSTCY